MKFTTLTKPDAEYEAWRAGWTPPHPRPRALPGKVIVEFGPFGTRGSIICPEEASNNAMVVSDGYEGRYHPEGYLPCGTEIVYTGTEGESFRLQGRTFMVVPKPEIEMHVLKDS